MHCRDGCSALRLRRANGAPKSPVLFWIREKGDKTHIKVTVPRKYLLSSYLVWVGVKFSNAKEEELLINDASQIGSKKFDFSIE